MRRIFAGLSGVSASLLICSVAFAAEQKQEGMPQLNFANPLTISQVVWLAFIFVGLYVLLAKWGLPQVAEVLEMRAARIGGDLDAARAAKESADAAVAEQTAATRQAQASAQAEINAAVDQAKHEAAAQAATLNQRLEAQLAEAETRIAQARAAAVGALRQVATETATTIISRLSGLSPSAAIIDGAVGDALALRAKA